MVQERLHYPGLDALRGIAILLVVLYHYFSFFRIGWIGVDLFFGLSGFLITDILLRTKNSDNYFRNFYLRRSLRIFPLYYFTLLVFYFTAPYVFSQKDPSSTYAYYTTHQTWFWTFTQNWLFIFHGPPPEPYLRHFWSLAIEEQFYLFWPFIIYFIKSNNQLKKILAFFFFLALAVRMSFWINNFSQIENFYCNTFSRMDSLSAGGFLSIMVYEERKIPRWFKLVCILSFVALIAVAGLYYNNLNNDSIAFKTIGYSISALFFMVICSFMLKDTIIGRSYILQTLGRISYGIYVYHIPVYLAASFLLKKIKWFNNNTMSTSLFIPLICIIITYIVSSISFRLLELPLLRLRNKFT